MQMLATGMMTSLGEARAIIERSFLWALLPDCDRSMEPRRQRFETWS